MQLKDNIQGIQHVGIPVVDLELSRKFYAKLGFAEVMRTELPVHNTVTRVAMMQQKSLTIELYQKDIEHIQQNTQALDGHIDHLALNVLDINSAYAEIKQAGFEIMENNAPVSLPFWDNGVSFFTIRGPDGEKIEFNQIL